MFDWINDLWGWISAVFGALKDFLLDLPLIILKSILEAVAGLIEAIPAPDFLTTFSIGSLLSNLPSGILYFLNESGLNDGMLILAAGFTFRMARKALTLFQW